MLSQEDNGCGAEEDEITTQLYQEGVSDNLPEDEPTDILSGEKEETTDILVTEATDIPVPEEDEATTLLVQEGDEETTLLTGEDEEATTLLVREGDEVTSVLNSDEMRMEAEFTQFEPVLQDDEELMALLQEAGANRKEPETELE